MTKNKEFWIWLAGFIDGEASISIQRQSTKMGHWNYLPKINIGNTNKKVLRYIVKNTHPESKIYENRFQIINNPNAKKMWNIFFSGKKCLPILEKVYPYLVIKKEQARLIKGWIISKKGNYKKADNDRKSRIYDRLKLLNKRGIK